MSISSKLPGLFVVGASLTIQFGPYLEKELKGRFRYDRKRDAGGERAEDDLDVPTGANAGDSSMVLAYLKRRGIHDPIDADVLLLSCGMHDLKTDCVTGAKQVAIERFESNLLDITSEVSAMHLKLAWLRITPVVDAIHNSRSNTFHRFSKDVDAYNAVADRVMRTKAELVVDLHDFCLPLLPQALIDHIHYNEEARGKQASFIASQLSEHFLTAEATL